MSPKIVVGTDYVEKRGFSIANVLPNYDNSGETFFQIVLDKKANKAFPSKDASFGREKIMSLYDSIYAGRSLDELLERDVVVQRFDTDKELNDMLAATEQLLGKGYVGTRYFSDPTDENIRYYVFEKKKEEAAVKAA